MQNYVIGGVIAVLVAILIVQMGAPQRPATRETTGRIARYDGNGMVVDTHVGLVNCGTITPEMIVELESMVEILRASKQSQYIPQIRHLIDEQCTQCTMLLRQTNMSASDGVHLAAILAGQEEHPNPMEWNTMDRKFMASEEREEEQEPIQGYEKNPVGVLAACLELLVKQLKAGLCTSGYINMRTLWTICRTLAGERPPWLVDREQQAVGLAQWDYLYDNSGDEFTRALEVSYMLPNGGYFNDPAPLIEPFKARRHLPRDNIHSGPKKDSASVVQRTAHSSTAQLGGQQFHFDNSLGTQARESFVGKLPSINTIAAENQVSMDWKYAALAHERNDVRRALDDDASAWATTRVLAGDDDMRGIELVGRPKNMLDNSFEGSVERDIISQRAPGYFMGYMRQDDNYTTWRAACMGNCPDDDKLWNECIAYDVSLQGALRGNNDSLFCPSTQSWAEWASDEQGRGVQ